MEVYLQKRRTLYNNSHYISDTGLICMKGNKNSAIECLWLQTFVILQKNSCKCSQLNKNMVKHQEFYIKITVQAGEVFILEKVFIVFGEVGFILQVVTSHICI